MPNETFLAELTLASADTILLWIWLGAVVIFFGHWLIASYHWYVYGSERAVSLLSIIIYGAGGLLLLAVMGGLLIAR